MNSLFGLASTIPPIPAKIVQKIQSNQFVDMKDLLPDNVALLDKLDGLGQALLHHQALVRACGKSLASCLGQAAIAIQSAANPDLACLWSANLKRGVKTW